jgi:hypothetical protein
MFFLARRRAEHLRGRAKFSLSGLAIGLGHLRRQANHGRGETDIIRARRALFVELGRVGLGIEGARSQFNDARPNGHGGIIAAAAAQRHPVATVMKPQTPNGVYRP